MDESLFGHTSVIIIIYFVLCGGNLFDLKHLWSGPVKLSAQPLLGILVKCENLHIWSRTFLICLCMSWSQFFPLIVISNQHSIMNKSHLKQSGPQDLKRHTVVERLFYSWWHTLVIFIIHRIVIFQVEYFFKILQWDDNGL